MEVEAYDKFAEVYDELMEEIPYEAWSRFLVDILKKYGVTGGTIAELGCGTGSMTGLLAKAGYEMIGLDLSVQMLSRAMDRYPDLFYVLQDMRNLNLPEPVRGVVSVCDCVNYICSEEELMQVFSGVYRSLKAGGVFFFDFHTDYYYREILGDCTMTQQQERVSLIWENSYDEESRCNRYDLTLFLQGKTGLYEKHTETHIQKGYTLESMKKLLEKAGLVVMECFDDYEKQPVKQNSQRIVVVACKPKQECHCSHERTLRALKSLGKEEGKRMLKEGEEIEMTCQFCGRVYRVTLDELKELLEEKGEKR